MSELKALIGYFDLDPNRVAQIVHLAYAAQPDNATFQRLLVPGALFSADAVRRKYGLMNLNYHSIHVVSSFHASGSMPGTAFPAVRHIHRVPALWAIT